MRIFRKSYMTLLETLIAMTLLSVVLTFVFGFFRELSGLSFLAEKAQANSFHMRYVESRLGFIFQRIIHEKKGKFFFYTQPPQNEFSKMSSLIFTYDNEVRLDPHFSGDVLGRLYVDFNHRLVLATWPLHVPNPHKFLHEEVLLQNVTQLSFSFYSPPLKTGSTNDTQGTKSDAGKKSVEPDKWIPDVWEFAYEQCPGIVKLSVKIAKNPKDLTDSFYGSKMETEENTFSFVLPSAINPIHYPPT
jgi:hypothetical protein